MRWFLGWCLLSTVALAQEQDPASLYELRTDQSATELKVGEKGKLVLSIHSKPGAHVSAEAPLKLELSAQGLKVPSGKLSRQDAVNATEKDADPRFEIPVEGAKAGSGSAEAKLTFFICTDKICARQVKTLTYPVAVK